MEKFTRPISNPESLDQSTNLSESEFAQFVLLMAAHKVIRQLAPELVDAVVTELCSLRAFRHNLN